MIKSSSEFWSLKSCARRSWPCWMMINGAIGVDRRPQQTAQSTSYNPYSGKRPINAINSNYLNRHPNFSRRPPYAYPSFDSSSSSSLYPQIFGPIPVPIQSMVPSSPILIQPPLADQQTVEMPPTGMWDDPHSQYHHAHHYPPTHVNVILDQHPAHMHPTVPMEAPPYWGWCRFWSSTCNKTQQIGWKCFSHKCFVGTHLILYCCCLFSVMTSWRIRLFARVIVWIFVARNRHTKRQAQTSSRLTFGCFCCWSSQMHTLKHIGCNKTRTCRFFSVFQSVH